MQSNWVGGIQLDMLLYVMPTISCRHCCTAASGIGNGYKEYGVGCLILPTSTLTRVVLPVAPQDMAVVACAYAYYDPRHHRLASPAP